MKNIRPLIKRIAAYSIDLLVVLTISSLITRIPILNKNMDSYQKTYDEYTEKYTEYSDYLNLLQKSFEDNEINEEEYNELIKNETYKEVIEEKYEDNKISKGEYNKIITNLNQKFDKTSKKYVYILNKKGVTNSIITLIATLLYFGVFQYLLKGQTIGKKFLKLKVVSASSKELNIFNYLLRSILVNEIIFNTADIIFLLTTSSKIYTKANNLIGIFISISEAIIVFLILTREDKRGLHDLLFNTQVIDLTESDDEDKKENPLIEEKSIIDNQSNIEDEVKIVAKKEKTTTKSKNNQNSNINKNNKEVKNNGKERKTNKGNKTK